MKTQKNKKKVEKANTHKKLSKEIGSRIITVGDMQQFLICFLVSLGIGGISWYILNLAGSYSKICPSGDLCIQQVFLFFIAAFFLAFAISVFRIAILSLFIEDYYLEKEN